MSDSASTLGIALSHFRSGRLGDAESLCRQILARQPQNAGALQLLGLVAHKSGRLTDAADLLGRACALAPAVPDFRNSLGTVLADLGRTDQAVAAFAAAMRTNPGYAPANRNRGITLMRAGRSSEAIADLGRAIELVPLERQAHELLAAACHSAGDAERLIDARRRTIRLWPDDARAHADLLLSLHYRPNVRPEEVFRAHIAWADRFAEPLSTSAAGHANDPSPVRKLRVGYLSPHFCDYPAPRFFGPILAAHDRHQFAVYCYADVARPDGVTERLRRTAVLGPEDVWRPISGASDDDVARLIREDRIDVLVDLAGHMDSRRLLVFARKPAPVQVSYLAYPDTTGMKAMGYRVTDSLHDPSGATERFYTEKLVRIDPCCWCYNPSLAGDTPDVNDLPARSKGHVTFASFNRLVKVTPEMIRLWAKILEVVPDARLAILANANCRGSCVSDRFRDAGIHPDRLHVIDPVPPAKYLELFHELDVLLDTFPYHGMTTTCDALWMGVPAVTLAGQTHVSRVGVSLMNAVGLPELVAQDEDAYVQIAVELTRNLVRLQELRAGLRQRMRTSPLMDGVGLTRRIEAAYRRMWHDWCSRQRRS